MDIFLLVLAMVAGFAFILGPIIWMLENNWSGWLQLAWLVFSVLSLVAGIGYERDRGPAGNFTLRTQDWQCTSTYQVLRFNGKVWYYTTECAEYSMKNRE